MAIMKTTQSLFRFAPLNSEHFCIAEGQEIDVRFQCQIDGKNQYYVRYQDPEACKEHCGYVPVESVVGASNIRVLAGQDTIRYVQTTTQTYVTPAATEVAFPVPRGLDVVYTGEKVNNYAHIRTIVSNSTYEGYINADYLKVSHLPYTPLQGMIDIANLEVGYTEKAEDDTKYGVWIGQNPASWCAAFVSWCAHFANNGTNNKSISALSTKILKTPLVADMRDYFGSHLYDEPVVGAVAFWGTSHVGLVVSVNGTKIDVIEGNAGSTVHRWTYTKVGNQYEYGPTNKITDFGYYPR